MKNVKYRTMEQQQWRRLSGERIKQPIEDEIRAVLVRGKVTGSIRQFEL